MNKVRILRKSEEMDALRSVIESKAGYKIRTTTDFETLSSDIQKKLQTNISSSTLKRIWGYVDGPECVRFSTLDILCRFVDHSDWESFIDSFNLSKDDSSAEYATATIDTKKLSQGDKIELRWNPDRIVVCEYEGLLQYRVASSVNSKLQEQDTFKCPFIIEGEPAVLDSLHRNGEDMGKYICGRDGGITSAKVIEKSAL